MRSAQALSKTSSDMCVSLWHLTKEQNKNCCMERMTIGGGAEVLGANWLAPVLAGHELQCIKTACTCYAVSVDRGVCLSVWLCHRRSLAVCMTAAEGRSLVVCMTVGGSHRVYQKHCWDFEQLEPKNKKRSCHVFWSVWPIIVGSGLDDKIYSTLTSRNYKQL
jgi:hypothetical protein